MFKWVNEFMIIAIVATVLFGTFVYSTDEWNGDRTLASQQKTSETK